MSLIYLDFLAREVFHLFLARAYNAVLLSLIDLTQKRDFQVLTIIVLLADEKHQIPSQKFLVRGLNTFRPCLIWRFLMLKDSYRIQHFNI